MLVNKNEVIKTIKDFGKQIIDRKTKFDIVDDFVELINCVEKVPKADYVEVVRCKDCSVPHNKWTGCPKLNGLIPPPNHYCSYGEKESEVQGE